MDNLDHFEDKLKNRITSDLTAKELAERIVVAALEAEYGHSFTLTPGFAKMVNTLADSIVTNPDLRRQALSVADLYVKQENERKESPRKNR